MAALLPLGAQAQQSPAVVKFKLQPFIKMTLTPNYATGFGTVPARIGTQPAPTPGANATLNGGTIDFGSVQQGLSYLYKFAAHVRVQTNDSAFTVYAQGTSDLTGTTDATGTPPGAATANGNSLPINQTLFYLPSSSGGTDPNNGFSGGFPFTSANATWNQGSITYGTLPPPIYTGTTSGTIDLYYDYSLHLGVSSSLGNYFVYVVYTAVAS